MNLAETPQFGEGAIIRTSPPTTASASGMSPAFYASGSTLLGSLSGVTPSTNEKEEAFAAVEPALTELNALITEFRRISKIYPSRLMALALTELEVAVYRLEDYSGNLVDVLGIEEVSAILGRSQT